MQVLLDLLTIILWFGLLVLLAQAPFVAARDIGKALRGEDTQKSVDAHQDKDRDRARQ